MAKEKSLPSLNTMPEWNTDHNCTLTAKKSPLNYPNTCTSTLSQTCASHNLVQNLRGLCRNKVFRVLTSFSPFFSFYTTACHNQSAVTKLRYGAQVTKVCTGSGRVTDLRRFASKGAVTHCLPPPLSDGHSPHT